MACRCCPSVPSCVFSHDAMTNFPLVRSTQLLVVTADGWDARGGYLRRFQRAGVGRQWQSLGDSTPVVLGRSGLGWGLGRHPESGGDGPYKCEGDGRAPAGVFEVTALFGDMRGAAAVPYPALPWLQAHADLKCVDDPGSRHYNRFVDQSLVDDPDWHSCEDVLRDDGRYALGAVIAHNAAPSRAGAGSCVFLHVWEAPGVPTAGCTACAFEELTEICRWLDAACHPMLVQLPEEIYRHRAGIWALPEN